MGHWKAGYPVFLAHFVCLKRMFTIYRRMTYASAYWTYSANGKVCLMPSSEGGGYSSRQQLLLNSVKLVEPGYETEAKTVEIDEALSVPPASAGIYVSHSRLLATLVAHLTIVHWSPFVYFPWIAFQVSGRFGHQVNRTRNLTLYTPNYICTSVVRVVK